MEDITSLQQLLNDNGTNINISDLLGRVMLWLIVPSVIMITILIIALIVNSVRRYRVERAIFEIRDTLREMKLAQQLPSISPVNTAQKPNTPTIEQGE